MKKWFFLLSIISLNSFSQSNLEKFNSENKNNSPGEALDVSIIQLISNPEKYDGKIIYVEGFIKIEFEGTALYLHQQDFEHRISKNAIWLNISREDLYGLINECSEKYGSIIGLFKSEPKGHFGMFSGTITDINGIYPDDYFVKD